MNRAAAPGRPAAGEPLLPCPFCGGANVESSTVTVSWFLVRCRDCEIEVDSHESLQAVETVWNTRAAAATRTDQAAEDNRFANDLIEAERLGSMDAYARALFGRLRQMDKRACAANARSAAAEARAREAVEVLHDVEWSADDRDENDEAQNVCPWCGQAQSEGKHSPTCRLAAAIRALPITDRPDQSEGGGDVD